AFVAAMALSVASARAMTIADPRQPASAGYFERVNAVIAKLNITVGPRAVAITIVLLGTIAVSLMVALFGAVLAAIRGSSQDGRHQWEGVLLSAIVVVMIAVCFSAAMWLSHLEVWQILGPVLLFLGLLTLLNAPFDWASLGLTRALLRRGLELGGWWPYVL